MSRGGSYGQGGRKGYDAKLLVEYLDTLRRPASYQDDIEGRIIRRWRRHAHGVTHDAADRMLACYGVRAKDFVAFCHAQEKDPTRTRR